MFYNLMSILVVIGIFLLVLSLIFQNKIDPKHDLILRACFGIVVILYLIATNIRY